MNTSIILQITSTVLLLVITILIVVQMVNKIVPTDISTMSMMASPYSMVPSTISIDGVTREFYISNSSTTANKLLIWFHGTAKNVMVDSTFNDIINDYLIIQPIGLQNGDDMFSWNSLDGASCNSSADDISFVQALLDQYNTSNITKVYCGGFSVGSGFTSRLSIDSTMSPQFDGFIMCSSGIQLSDLNNISLINHSPNIFLSNGAIDPISPYLGGQGNATGSDGTLCYNFSPLLTTVNKWSNQINGSNTIATTDSAGNKIYQNSNVYGIVFSNTVHAPASESVTSWLNSQSNPQTSLYLQALKIFENSE